MNSSHLTDNLNPLSRPLTAVTAPVCLYTENPSFRSPLNHTLQPRSLQVQSLHPLIYTPVPCPHPQKSPSKPT